MIAKPNSEISGGGPYILQATFLARGQINNVFGITGKSGMNIVVFARPKTGKRFGFHKEILTKVASISPHGLNKRKEFHSKNRICYN